jgi:hypothetical protein
MNSRPVKKAGHLPFQPSYQCIKVSVHQLVNDLLASLQPLANKRNNLLVNGVPREMCFIAEENLFAYVLWNLISGVNDNKKNESIHVQTLVDDHRTMICVKDAGTYLYRSLASDYRRLQDAAEKIGGCIDMYIDETHGCNIAFSISNTRMAVAN